MSLLSSSRRTLAAGAALAAVSLLVLAGHGSTAAGADDASVFTMRFEPASFKLVDAPPKAASETSPPGPGDYFVLKNRLFKGERRLGALHATCVVTNRGTGPGNIPILCSGVYRLPGGTLVGSALLSTGSTVSRIAVTGGTGRFAGMTGVATEFNEDDGTGRILVRVQ
jgi:hypothetical protein